MEAEPVPLLQGADEPTADVQHSWSPISLVNGCARVGHCLDLWRTDPQKLLELLEEGSQMAKAHPLRCLFSPLARLPESGAPANGAAREASEFAPGQRVKVRLCPELKESMRQEYDFSRNDFYDPTKEWEPATIAAQNPDGTLTVTWDAGYQAGRVQDAADIRAFEVGAGVQSGIQHVVQTKGQSGRLGWGAAGPMLSIAAGVACVPQLLATAFAKDPCAEADADDAFPMALLCSAGGASFAKSGGGLVVGALSLACSLVAGLLVLPGVFACARRCCPVRAQQARQTVETVRNGGLPTVYGLAENLILAFFVAMNASGLLMAVITLDPGLFPLTALLARYFLLAMNTCFGEKSGFKDLRKKRIMSLLEDQLGAAKVALTAEQLRLEVDRLLELPSNAGIVHLGVEVVALIASMCPVEVPDSVRTRVFVVERAFAEYTQKMPRNAALRKKFDVVVDVFEGTCEVPGLTLAGERWRKEGDPLAWHLAVLAPSVRTFELELQELGLPKGAGCFSWSNSNGVPATAEAADTSASVAHGKRLVAERNSRTTAMFVICHAPHLADDPELIRGFLHAGVDVNQKFPPSSIMCLGVACSHGKAETVKLLLAEKADVNAARGHGMTPLHTAARRGHLGTVETLVAAGADLHATDNDGETPLHSAAAQGRLGTVQALIAAGADLHAKMTEPSGFTPLHMAIAGGGAEVAKALAEAGADHTLKDDFGQAPLELTFPEALQVRDEVRRFIEELGQRRAGPAAPPAGRQ